MNIMQEVLLEAKAINTKKMIENLESIIHRQKFLFISLLRYMVKELIAHGAFIMQLILNIILVRSNIKVAYGGGGKHDVSIDIVVIQLEIFGALLEEEGMVAKRAIYL